MVVRRSICLMVRAGFRMVNACASFLGASYTFCSDINGAVSIPLYYSVYCNNCNAECITTSIVRRRRD